MTRPDTEVSKTRSMARTRQDEQGDQMSTGRELRRRETRRARAAVLIGGAVLDEFDAVGSDANGTYVNLLYKLSQDSKRESDRTILSELIEQFVGQPASPLGSAALSYPERLELVLQTSTTQTAADAEAADVPTQPSSYSLRTASDAAIGSVELAFEKDAIAISGLRIEREYRSDHNTERALQAIGAFATHNNLHRLRVSLGGDRTRLIERFRSLGFKQNARSGKNTILERSAEAEDAV